MSGGVDSSVAALLLKQAGYEVVGLFMKLWHDPCGVGQNACCDDQALADARAVADKIGISFYEVDAREKFKKDVADYFVDEYQNLRTPNPCVVCNKKIKFGWLLDFAEKLDCKYLATGHYARIVNSSQLSIFNYQFPVNDQLSIEKWKLTENWKLENGNLHLLKGVDEQKDQSYFLYQLNQNQLAKILFPLGEMTKAEVRQIAKENNLPVYEKAESQEVCFVSDNDYRKFLKRNLQAESSKLKVQSDPFKPGNIVTLTGEIIGKHDGLANYTIGQRKGILQVKSSKLKVQSDTKPLYVVGFNKEKNELIVGEDKELWWNEFQIEKAHFITQKSKVKSQNCNSKPDNLSVKVRYKAEDVPCTVSLIHDSLFMIQLARPIRAITPGQSAVFYFGDEVIGGGIIV